MGGGSYKPPGIGAFNTGAGGGLAKASPYGGGGLGGNPYSGGGGGGLSKKPGSKSGMAKVGLSALGGPVKPTPGANGLSKPNAMPPANMELGGKFSGGGLGGGGGLGKFSGGGLGGYGRHGI